MEGRTVVQWDKDDCADAGLLKIDLLGLGMLTMIHRAFRLIERGGGEKLTLADFKALWRDKKRKMKTSTTPSARPTRWACFRSRAARR